MKILMIGMMMMSQAFAFEVSLDRSVEIVEDEIVGRVTYRCSGIGSGGIQIQTYSCYDSNLRGGNYGSVIVSNGTIDADFVKLQREGSKYIKGSKFDSESGRTGANFNLWVRSAFQRSLLKRGLNKIKYKFYKNRNIVNEGFFEVEVKSGDSNDCGWGNISFRQCLNPNQVCDEYFRRRNYCQ